MPLLELAQAVEAGHANPQARVLVITGAGRGFCAGQDLGAFSRPPGGSESIEQVIQKTYNRLILAISNGDKPVITAVNGIAAGAGANLALAGDIRVWSEEARFTEAFSSIALIPDAGGRGRFLERWGIIKRSNWLRFQRCWTQKWASSWGCANGF